MHHCLQLPAPTLFDQDKVKPCTHLECMASSDPVVQAALGILGGTIESVTPIKKKLVKKAPARPVITRR